MSASPGLGTLGDYRLEAVIGEGGMARVYRAVLPGPMGFHKVVAIKQILPQVTRQERLLRALINEARAGGLLQHRNVVQVFDFKQIEGTWALVMEYVEGRSLDRVLKGLGEGECIPPQVVLDIGVQACSGLHYVHGAADEAGKPMNLVHRDLKPSNIIVARDGTVKIMDFGVVRADSNVYHTVDQDSVKGTPSYMSPEQATRGPLDFRSDLFSLATVLADLTTRRVTFRGAHVPDIMRRVADVNLGDTLAAVDAAIPGLGPVLARAWQVRPESRHGSAAELGNDLARLRQQYDAAPSLETWIEPWLGEPRGHPLAPSPARAVERPGPPPSPADAGPPASGTAGRGPNHPTAVPPAGASEALVLPPRHGSAPAAASAGSAGPVSARFDGHSPARGVAAPPPAGVEAVEPLPADPAGGLVSSPPPAGETHRPKADPSPPAAEAAHEAPGPPSPPASDTSGVPPVPLAGHAPSQRAERPPSPPSRGVGPAPGGSGGVPATSAVAPPAEEHRRTETTSRPGAVSRPRWGAIAAVLGLASTAGLATALAVRGCVGDAGGPSAVARDVVDVPTPAALERRPEPGPTPSPDRAAPVAAPETADPGDVVESQFGRAATPPAAATHPAAAARGGAVTPRDRAPATDVADAATRLLDPLGLSMGSGFLKRGVEERLREVGQAAGALGSLAGAGLAWVVTNDPSPTVQLECVRVAARRLQSADDPEALRALEVAVGTAGLDPNTRIEAARALARFGRNKPSTARALRETLADPRAPSGLKEEVRKALSRVEGVAR